MKILGLIGRGLMVVGFVGYVRRDFPELTSRVEGYMREIGNQLLSLREMSEEGERVRLAERAVTEQRSSGVVQEIDYDLSLNELFSKESSVGLAEGVVIDQARSEIQERNGLSTVMYLFLLEAIRLSVSQFPEWEGFSFPPTVFDMAESSERCSF